MLSSICLFKENRTDQTKSSSAYYCETVKFKNIWASYLGDDVILVPNESSMEDFYLLAAYGIPMSLLISVKLMKKTID